MVFVRLTLVTSDERVVRLRASQAELARSTGGQPGQVDKVVEVFARRYVGAGFVGRGLARKLSWVAGRVESGR